ncbi:MAG: hypothetical protein ACI9CO_000714 [Candidatus Azotimanducaceae bacterium]|jgi:hypothetical protein
MIYQKVESHFAKDNLEGLSTKEEVFRLFLIDNRIDSKPSLLM